MAEISQCSASDIERFCTTIFEPLRAARTFETASRILVQSLRNEFENIALARVFGTVEYQQLPDSERRFAAAIASDFSLFPTTEVLTLFGTSGIETDWQDRRRSERHLAMPLLNWRSINDAPMLSKLLNDLHYTVTVEQPTSRAVPTRAFANANALCYIADAGTSVDILGRSIIPAIDFVRSYNIRTVVGVGGSYIVARMFVAVVLFTSENILKDTATHLLPLSNTFKAATSDVVLRNALFDER
jgi:hypothetical protein